jgi:F-type H+-transporting ATPase subunit b
MIDHLMLAAAAAEPSVPEKIAQTFGWNASLFISQVISFCVVAFLLKKFAYGPILNLLAERQKTIQQSLENAEKIKAELAQAETERKRLISEASAAAAKIIEEARAAAAAITERESQKAVTAAAEIIAKAKQANESEFKRLEAELKREIGSLAVKAAMQVSGKILTAEDQKRLAEETNRQLAA